MTIKTIACKCGQFLCQRRGDTLIYHSLKIDLRRSHNIECPACGEHTKFSVDQRKKSIDSQVPIGENRVNLS